MNVWAGPGRGPVVIFIAGSGRSGSTLVERAIGGTRSCVNVGEVIDLFRREAAQQERCGCGSRVGECTFWQAVGKRAFGGWSEQSALEVSLLQQRVARQRHLPRLLASLPSDVSFRSDVCRYADHFIRLYEAISLESSAPCVVDASKWPVQALALFRGGVDVRILHLVRDPRGVAFSLAKKDVPRTQGAAPGETMWHNSHAGAALRWDAFQAECELLAKCGAKVTRLRYEDFAGNPRVATARALEGLQVNLEPAELDHISRDSIELTASHGVSGNPSRFKTGSIQTRSDETWRNDMKRGHRLAVTALTAPLMRRYRQPGMAGATPPQNGRGRSATIQKS